MGLRESLVSKKIIQKQCNRKLSRQYPTRKAVITTHMLLASAGLAFAIPAPSYAQAILGLTHASSGIFLTDGKEPTITEDKVNTSVENQPISPLALRAMDYIRFRQDVADLESLEFDNAEVTREAHRRLAAHEPWTLSSGWMAYAAMIAADTPEFAEALRADIRGPEEDKKSTKKRKKRKKRKKGEPEPLTGRDAFLAKLSANPRYPRSLPGADKAIQAIMTMSNNDELRFKSLGENFKSHAYAMQKTRWGKKRIAPGAERLSDAEYYASTRPGVALPKFEASMTDGVRMTGVTKITNNWRPEWGYKSSIAITHAKGSGVIMDRILNLAARYAVGSVNENVLNVYAKNKKAEQCLALNKLKLKGCISATRSPYEEAFCLGEHGLNEVASCVDWVSAN